MHPWITARYALVLWFNDQPQGVVKTPLPPPDPGEVLLRVPKLPLLDDHVAFLQLSDEKPVGHVSIHCRASRPGVAVVSTVYKAANHLPAFCEHHLAAGVDHLLLIFDDLNEPGEATTAQDLANRFGDRLTIWNGAERMAQWLEQLPADPRLEKVRALMALGPQVRTSSHGVCARQTLGASAALMAARSGELGGRPLQWLVHLDADERLCAEGTSRGGVALSDCFAAAEGAGIRLIRFLNHELFPGMGNGLPRFKVNPRLAQARLGTVGWERVRQLLRLGDVTADMTVDMMGAGSVRPWFLGYHNGKSAVATAHGHLAAGVHGWYLKTPPRGSQSLLLAGPHVCHFHLPDCTAFVRKFSAKAASKVPTDAWLFEPSPMEVATRRLIEVARAEGLDNTAIEERLEAFYEKMVRFSSSELELLEEADLLIDFPESLSIAFPSSST